MPLIEARSLTKTYTMGHEAVHALAGVSLDIEAGEFVAIMGSSGSGKSTLMNILGCLDRPTEGSYRVHGAATEQMSPDELAHLRRVIEHALDDRTPPAPATAGSSPP